MLGLGRGVGLRRGLGVVRQDRRAAREVSKWGRGSRRDIRGDIGAGDRVVAETGREGRGV
jgi:hypothetical protein